jgi:hypothetical protein
MTAVLLLAGGCVVSVIQGGGLPLSSLGRADVAIVVGTGDQNPGGLTVTVQRVIQGPVSVSETVPVEWTSAAGDACKFSQRVHGLWFLQDTPTGWVAIPNHSPPVDLADVAVSLPEADAAPQQARQELDQPIDRMIAELLVATESEDMRVAAGGYEAITMIMLAARKAGGFRHRPRNLALDHGGTLLSKLLWEWDLSVVGRVERDLASNPKATDSPALQALYSIRDPRVIPTLGRIWESGFGGRFIRRGVVEAIRAIHSEDAIPLLLRFLDEKDWETRYAGVSGLAMLAANCRPGGESEDCPQPHGDPAITATYPYHPSVDRFQRDPDPYVSFWKAWVAKRRRAATLPPGNTDQTRTNLDVGSALP